MKIVVDDKIPYIREALERLADEVVYRNGSDIAADDVRDADALIVRTRTRCDKRLLDGSRVRFVATATIGFDHLAVEQHHCFIPDDNSVYLHRLCAAGLQSDRQRVTLPAARNRRQRHFELCHNGHFRNGFNNRTIQHE